jgi:hypothetical protein
LIDPKAWEIFLDIMKEEGQWIIEEKTPDGNHYLSAKSPLVIRELYNIAKEVSRYIASALHR